MAGNVGDIRLFSLRNFDRLLYDCEQVGKKLQKLAEEIESPQLFSSWQGKAASMAHQKFNFAIQGLFDLLANLTLIIAGMQEYLEGMQSVQKHLANLTDQAEQDGFNITDDDRVVNERDSGLIRQAILEVQWFLGSDYEKHRLELQVEIERILREIINSYTNLNNSVGRIFTTAKDHKYRIDGIHSVTELIQRSKICARIVDLAIPDEVFTDSVKAQKWWNSLSLAKQKQLIREDFEIIGNLNGIPFHVRSEANLRHLINSKGKLSGDKAVARQRIEDILVERYQKDHSRQGSLEDILTDPQTLAEYTAGKHGNLILFDPYSSDQLLASMAIGDLDNADKILVQTYGVGTTVQSSIADKFKEGEAIKAGMEKISNHNRKNKTTSAMVINMDYVTPPSGVHPSAYSKNDDLAIAGANNLTHLIEGIDAANHPVHGGETRITAAGHSYGSIVTYVACTQTQPGMVDNIVLQGSPGVPDDPINVPQANRFYEISPTDDVPELGKFRSKITNDNDIRLNSTFQGLSTNTIQAPDGEIHQRSFGHSEYTSNYQVGKDKDLHLRSAAYNLAAVATDRDDMIVKTNRNSDYASSKIDTAVINLVTNHTIERAFQR